MITRVFIKGYKSLRDIDISLKPLTVIVGPNASGKSNLLDALGLLSRIVTSRTINEAFDEHRGLPLEAFSLPPGGLEELLQQEKHCDSLWEWMLNYHPDVVEDLLKSKSTIWKWVCTGGVWTARLGECGKDFCATR